MQSLWTRASQLACTCRCPSCLHQKASIVRRVSSVAGKFTSRPFSTGTLLYSAIFAAACSVDSTSKEQRKKKWDNAISKTKRDIESIEETHEKRISAILTSYDGAVPEPFQDDLTSVRLTTHDVVRWSPGISDKRPPLPMSTAEDVHPEHLAPQSLWSGPERRLKAARREWTEKKLRLTELAITRLVLNMLLAADIDSKSGAELEGLPPSVRPFASLSRADQRRAVREVKAEVSNHVALLKPWERGDARQLPVPTPHYKQLEADRHWRIDSRLARTFKTLFEDLNQKQVSFESTIINICDQLLTSPVPLTLQPYNTLLVGFLRHDKSIARFAAIEALVDLGREAHIRPNEFTCAAILRSYRVRNDPFKFAKFVSLMRAHDDALMLANPTIQITDACKGRLVRKGNKVLQGIAPSTMVYRELILGVLKFVGFDTAIEIVKRLNSEHWGLDWDCLHLLMMDCVMRGAWDDGMLIWKQMELLAIKAGGLVPDKIQAMMLALCKACERLEEFNKKFEQALKDGYSRERILQLVTRVFAAVGQHTNPKASNAKFTQEALTQEGEFSVEATEERNESSIQRKEAVENDAVFREQRPMGRKILKPVLSIAPLNFSKKLEWEPIFDKESYVAMAAP